MPPDEFDTADELALHRPALKVRARRLIGPRLRKVLGSSDLVQDTMVVAVRRLSELSGRPSRQVLAWLLQVMQFRLMHHVRDHGSELACARGDAQTVEEVAPSSAGAIGRIVHEEIRAELWEMIEQLPEDERRVVVALYRERRTTDEIAAELGRSQGAVRALHQRALRHLRHRFGGETP